MCDGCVGIIDMRSYKEGGDLSTQVGTHRDLILGKGVTNQMMVTCVNKVLNRESKRHK